MEDLSRAQGMNHEEQEHSKEGAKIMVFNEGDWKMFQGHKG